MLTTLVNWFHTFSNSFLIGANHAALLAFPITPPLLICLRRLLIEGSAAAFASYLGTALGHTFFVFLILAGFRDFINLWYEWEPVLYFLGALLTFGILLDFSLESRSSFLSWPFLGTGGFYARTEESKKLLKYFFINFLLMFLNPVICINSTPLIINNDTIQKFGGGLSEVFPLSAYLCGLFLTLLGVSSSCGVVFRTVTGYFYQRSYKSFRLFMAPINQFLAVLGICLVFTATGRYTFRLFFEYPAETASATLSSSSVSPSSSGLLEEPQELKPGLGGLAGFNALKTQEGRRAFDTGNIEKKDAIVYAPYRSYLQRNFPLSQFKIKLNDQKRASQGRPKLTRQQLEQINFRYNSHLVNKISKFVYKTNWSIRTPFDFKSTLDQQLALEEAKQVYFQKYFTLQAQLFEEKYKNQGKGNPQHSFIRSIPLALERDFSHLDDY